MKKMFKIPLFGKKKLLLAFEYGTVIADVLHEQNRVLTPGVIERCEEIITKEFTAKSTDRVALDMIPNLLASLEIKD